MCPNPKGGSNCEQRAGELRKFEDAFKTDGSIWGLGMDRGGFGRGQGGGGGVDVVCDGGQQRVGPLPLGATGRGAAGRFGQGECPMPYHPDHPAICGWSDTPPSDLNRDFLTDSGEGSSPEQAAGWTSSAG